MIFFCFGRQHDKLVFLKLDRYDLSSLETSKEFKYNN